MIGFKITGGKGFHIGFANGWKVSVQFGPGNYGDNYDMEIGVDDAEAGRLGSTVAEIAVIDPDGDFMEFSDTGNTVAGHVSPDEVLEWMQYAASRAPEARNTTPVAGPR